MKKKDITTKSPKELMDTLKEKRAKLAEFRFNILGGKMKNVKEGKALRKEIAQILTQLNTTK